ncbi:Hypothetical protein R9X50_00661600 [Acrodontium crateriforme]|uniref:Uncharacterized protein n=1 Tax=Acrodontium crateriforme TaxID=150365 RepID=A0AAQ3RDP7_9PEZI|nr:Hypothetical protein R9X50_00661600 [Acrodontium crateriforme]
MVDSGHFALHTETRVVSRERQRDVGWPRRSHYKSQRLFAFSTSTREMSVDWQRARLDRHTLHTIHLQLFIRPAAPPFPVTGSGLNSKCTFSCIQLTIITILLLIFTYFLTSTSIMAFPLLFCVAEEAKAFACKIANMEIPGGGPKVFYLVKSRH